MKLTIAALAIGLALTSTAFAGAVMHERPSDSMGVVVHENNAMPTDQKTNQSQVPAVQNQGAVEQNGMSINFARQMSINYARGQ